MVIFKARNNIEPLKVLIYIFSKIGCQRFPQY